MSARAWVKPLAIASGVAASAGAAQLGIAYGLSILLWAKDFTDPSESAWAANLTWVCWLAATSVVAGAVAGGRVVWTSGLPRWVLARIAVVVSAGVGGLATVPLVAIPARYAELADDGSPALTAARVAAIGVLLGAVVSVGVLLGRPLAWNVVATGAWIWLLALGSVLLALRSGGAPDETRLAIFGTAESWFPVMVPMLLSAAVIGAGIALLAKREGRHRVSVAVCGAPGPLLVAVAYLVAGPGSRPEAGDQFLPYLAAPYAVLTGLLGSLLVAAIERPEQEEGAETAPEGEEEPTAQTPVAAIEAAPAGSLTSAGPAAGSPAFAGSLTAPDAVASPERADAVDDADFDDADLDEDGRPGALPTFTSEELEGLYAAPPVPPVPRRRFLPDPEPGSATQHLSEPDSDRAPPRFPPEPEPDHASTWHLPRVPPTEQGAMSSPQPYPAPSPTPVTSSGPAPEDAEPPTPVASEPEAAEPGRHGRDADDLDDDERWLQQIRGDDDPRHFVADDDPRHFRAAPIPEVEQSKRRKWKLFADDDEDTAPGQR